MSSQPVVLLRFFTAVQKSNLQEFFIPFGFPLLFNSFVSYQTQAAGSSTCGSGVLSWPCRGAASQGVNMTPHWPFGSLARLLKSTWSTDHLRSNPNCSTSCVTLAHNLTILSLSLQQVNNQPMSESPSEK